MYWLGSIKFEEEFPYNLIRIEAIHIFHKLTILKDFHFGKRMYTHLATEVMIDLIAVNLINGDGPCIFGLEFINDLLKVLAVSTPGGKKLEYGDSIVSGLWVDD